MKKILSVISWQKPDERKERRKIMMKGNRKHWQSVMTIIGVALWFMVLATMVNASTTTRPISDFIETQGTFCIDDGMGGCFLFVPPVANFIGWSDLKANLCASVDYAGLANEYVESASGGAVSFSTETDGTVIERPLPDGRAEVTILLHTKNALTWIIDGCEDFATNPLLFGHRAPDVLGGEDAALGESSLKVGFVNTAPGDPLPDLEQLIFAPLPGQEFPSFISFRAQADGMLADGTPGRVEVTQTGLFITSFMGATADGFPAEKIILRAVGK